MAPGQTLQAAADVLEGFLKEGVFVEHTVEVQVEQGNTWEQANTSCGKDFKWFYSSLKMFYTIHLFVG